MVKKIVSLLIISVIHFSVLAQNDIKVEGVIIDGKTRKRRDGWRHYQ